jgi:poly(3-hydroxybutyrate) depolymerase
MTAHAGFAPSRRLAPWIVALGGLAGCGGGSPETREPPLPRLPIAVDSLTVSGLSSGGSMAVQFHVAHSSTVQGAGVLAAGPYLCAEGSMRHALGRCMQANEEIPTGRLLETTSVLALHEQIDPIAGLSDDRVWIFHGAADVVVRKAVVDALETYYRALVDPAQVSRTEHPQAGHTFPASDGAVGPCFASESPFIGDCGVDGARRMLEHLYGELAADAAPRDPGLVEFDQRPYAEAAGSAAFADRGWLYVPAGCEAGAAGPCRLHVVFHGCKQGPGFVGDTFVRRAGYLPVAEANRIVLLFPQVDRSFQPLNPNGCWDWWGYEGEAYATHDGPQIRAVQAMVGDLMGGAAAAN